MRAPVIANPFAVGDHVFMGRSGIESMLYYIESKRQWECPCTWLNVRGTVKEIRGNFVFLEEDGHRSAFHHRDLYALQPD